MQENAFLEKVLSLFENRSRMSATHSHLSAFHFVLALLVDVSFCASTSLNTSIDECISFVSLQLAVDDLTDWTKDTTHTSTTNRHGDIWKIVPPSTYCDQQCIKLSGAYDGSASLWRDVWIEQVLDVSSVKGQDIKIGIHGWTVSMNNAGEKGWIQIGCDAQIDPQFTFNEEILEAAEYTTCSIIQNSNCNTLTVWIGGMLSGNS